MPLFISSRLVAFKGLVLPAAPVWGGGSIPLTGPACFLFPGERREKAEKYFVCLLEKLEISMVGFGVKCCLKPLE